MSIGAAPLNSGRPGHNAEHHHQSPQQLSTRAAERCPIRAQCKASLLSPACEHWSSPPATAACLACQLWDSLDATAASHTCQRSARPSMGPFILLSVPGPDVPVPPVCSLACFTPGNVGFCPIRRHQQACGLGSWASGLVHVVHLNARRCAAKRPFGHVLLANLLAPQLQQACSQSASAFSLHLWKTGIGVCEIL